MKNKILSSLMLVLFVMGLVIIVSSCEKDEKDPLPYISVQR